MSIADRTMTTTWAPPPAPGAEISPCAAQVWAERQHA